MGKMNLKDFARQCIEAIEIDEVNFSPETIHQTPTGKVSILIKGRVKMNAIHKK